MLHRATKVYGSVAGFRFDEMFGSESRVQTVRTRPNLKNRLKQILNSTRSDFCSGLLLWRTNRCFHQDWHWQCKQKFCSGIRKIHINLWREKSQWHDWNKINFTECVLNALSFWIDSLIFNFTMLFNISGFFSSWNKVRLLKTILKTILKQENQ